MFKVWQFNVNQAMGSGASSLAANQDLVFKIKSSLIGFASFPWAIWGSCDGVSFSNGTGTDYWVNSGDLIWSGIGGAHSWIVLSQPALGPNAAICIDLMNGAGTSQYVPVYLSMVGFGAANGGTDGTATAKPVATDEALVNIQFTSLYGGSSAAFTGYLHVMESDDGTITRVICCIGGVPRGFWSFELATENIPEWDPPVMGTLYGSGATAMSAQYVATTSSQSNNRLFIGGVPGYVWYSGEGYGTTLLCEAITVADPDLGEWPIFPMTLFGDVYVHRGRKGSVIDMWWGSSGVATGDCYPADGSRQFAQFGNMIFPWDGSVPLIT
jgi:hypothetical protein